ncbi:MAG: hypothetical protein ACYTKD_10080 [Planctomycetota bacterium]|jgi:hypothetical protein
MRTVLGCLGAALLAAVVGVVLIWFCLIRELPKLDAKLSLAPEATLGSTATMVVVAKNPHEEPVTLDSIDIDESFLAGFQVISIDPEPTDTSNVPLLDQRSWSFGEEIAPGESHSVTFNLRPVSEGRFTGDVDVCNPSQDYKTLLADVVVKKAAPGEPVDGGAE